MVVRKKDGTARVCQDSRGLNALLKNDSGGLGDLPGIFDDMKGAGWYTSIDLASGFTKLEIAEEDKHKTAFRDAYGELWEFNRCGFGLKTLPSAFFAYIGGSLGSLRRKGVKNWLDDISITSRLSYGLDGHLRLVDDTLTALHKAKLSVNFAKCKWCAPHMEFVGMVVDRLGVRPSQSKIDAVTQLAPVETVEVTPRHDRLLEKVRTGVQHGGSAHFGSPQRQTPRIQEGKESQDTLGHGTR